MMTEIAETLRDKRVLLTGHTGFKGGWLSLWLKSLGAEVYGIALEPVTSPSMFDVCQIRKDVDHYIGDIRNFHTIYERVCDVKPDLILHLAAQPLVRQSYENPLETIETNVMGTANVLEAVRRWGDSCAVVIISSDKCYSNHGWIWGYRENDPMGGEDPYSASKGATELVTNSWRESYFAADGLVRIASARAGNVIGGGDWANDRIVPDFVRAICAGRQIELRQPNATRPWQHVLEPLCGYLLLASKLLGPDAQNYCSGWNFGPNQSDVRPVSELITMMAEHWNNSPGWYVSPAQHPKEASTLSLNCDKAIALLGWKPTWTIASAIKFTMSWYQAWHEGRGDLRTLSLDQIMHFQRAVDGSSIAERK